MAGRNHEGYRDPTASRALALLERQHRRQKHRRLSYRMAAAGGFVKAAGIVRGQNHDK